MPSQPEMENGNADNMGGGTAAKMQFVKVGGLPGGGRRSSARTMKKERRWSSGWRNREENVRSGQPGFSNRRCPAPLAAASRRPAGKRHCGLNAGTVYFVFHVFQTNRFSLLKQLGNIDTGSAFHLSGQ